jgi:hypothetical protein
MMERLKYPRLPRSSDKRVKINEEIKEQIIQMRNQDPKVWTYQKLGKMFKISRTSTARICDPEQKKRANETTKRFILKRLKNDPEFRKKETKRIADYLKKRESESEEFKKYHKQFTTKEKQK